MQVSENYSSTSKSKSTSLETTSHNSLVVNISLKVALLLSPEGFVAFTDTLYFLPGVAPIKSCPDEAPAYSFSFLPLRARSRLTVYETFGSCSIIQSATNVLSVTLRTVTVPTSAGTGKCHSGETELTYRYRLTNYTSGSQTVSVLSFKRWLNG